MIKTILKRCLLAVVPFLFFSIPAEAASVDSLTEETAPAAADVLYLAKDAGGGSFLDRKVTFNNLVPTLATTAEVSAGVVTGKYIDPDSLAGSVPALSGATITATFDNASGSQEAFSSTITNFPTSATTATGFSILGRYVEASTQAMSGDQHGVAVIGNYVNSASTQTVPLGIGTEGVVIQNVAGGVITQANGLLSNNLSNVGTMTEYNGARHTVISQDGTLDKYNGVKVELLNGSGTVTTMNGVAIEAATNSGGTLTDMVGFLFRDQTAFAGDVTAFQNLDPNAPIKTIGPIELNGTTSGTATIQATPTGGNLNIGSASLLNGTEEVLLFSDVASAVNEITIKNAATGNGAEIQATGDDTNIDLLLTPKGTGAVDIGALKLPTADGTANHILATDGAGILALASVFDSFGIKGGQFTVEADRGTGTQAYTGVGGTPIFIYFSWGNSVSTQEAGSGWTDCTTNQGRHINSDNGNTLAHAHIGTVAGGSDSVLLYNEDSGFANILLGTIKTGAGSCDSDGFTISYTQIGTPASETLVVNYFAVYAK